MNDSRAPADLRGGQARPVPGRSAVLPVAGAAIPDGVRGDAAVARLAAQQHGVVSYAQLIACGLNPGGIDHRVRRGRLHRLHRGVYAVGHGAVGFEGQVLAAVLAAGQGAVASHHSAGRLLELLPAGAPASLGVDPIDVTITGGRNARPRSGVRRHRSLDLDARDLRWRGPIPTTSAARTVLDVAGADGPRAAERMLAAAFRSGSATEAEVRSLVSRSQGRAGTRAVAELLRSGPAFDRSVAERMLLELLRGAELPEPRMNAWVGGFEVDGLWERHRTVVEFESFTFHGDRIAFRRDRRKSARLQAQGYGVVPVIWEDLHGAPTVVVATVAAVLALAEERLR